MRGRWECCNKIQDSYTAQVFIRGEGQGVEIVISTHRSLLFVYFR